MAFIITNNNVLFLSFCPYLGESLLVPHSCPIFLRWIEVISQILFLVLSHLSRCFVVSAHCLFLVNSHLLMVQIADRPKFVVQEASVELDMFRSETRPTSLCCIPLIFPYSPGAPCCPMENSKTPRTAPRNLKRVAKELGERMTDEELQAWIIGLVLLGKS